MFQVSLIKPQRFFSVAFTTYTTLMVLDLSACTLTIRVPAPPPSAEEIMATAVEQTMQADPGARPQEEIATSVAATMQSQPEDAPPGIQIDNRTATAPSSPGSEPDSAQPTPAANPQPGSTNSPQPQQQDSVVPTSTSHMQSIITDTPGLPFFVTDTPGLPFFITDTPGLPYMVTNTPGMFSLATETPVGIHQLANETPTSQPSPNCLAPKAPSNLVFNKWLGNDRYSPLVGLWWQDNAEFETNFRIYYVNEGLYQQYGRDSEAGSYPAPSQGLCNRQMIFYVTANNECGESPASNQVTVTGQCAPGKPGLSLKSSEYMLHNNSVIYSFWVYAPAENQHEVLYYNVYHTQQQGVYYQANPPEYSFTLLKECSLAESDVYVTAINFGGESLTSELITLAGQACPTWQPSGSGF